MGIKDNFSQAVKELWKKDGMEDSAEVPAAREGGPTQLDRYLAEQEQQMSAPDMTAQPQAAPAQPVSPVQNTEAQPVAAPTQQAPASQPMPAEPQQETNVSGVPLETPYFRPQPTAAPQNAAQTAQPQAAAPAQNNGFAGNANAGYNANDGFGGGYAPSAPGNINANRAAGVTDEVTVISKNTVIDGNVRSLANMQLDGNIKGNIETTRDIDMTGKVVGDIKCNNVNMNSAAMQGNVAIKGKMRMDRDTILIGDLTSQYADVNGRIRGKLEIAGKAELKRDAIVFGDINASTIAVTDGAIIQGYVNTTFLSKEDSRNAFPDAISLDSGKEANTN